MSLGSLVQETIKTSTLKDLIRKNFKESRAILPLREEDDAYVRASSLAHLCPREEVLCNLLNVTNRMDRKNADSMLTLMHGVALHWALQNKILPTLGDILVGQWSCLNCGTVYGDPGGGKSLSSSLVPRPKVCSNKNMHCNSTDFQYLELHFKNPEYRIGGHPDGFLKMDGMPGLGILEAKSVSSENALKVINMPFFDHVVQAHIYMWLTRTEWATFLYWDKGERGLTNSIIEHTIYKDEELIEKIKDDLKSIWEGIKTKTLPERNPKICEEETCTRAKKCVVSSICFNSDRKIKTMEV